MFNHMNMNTVYQLPVPRTINSKPCGLEFIDSTRLRFIDYKTVLIYILVA